MKLTNYAYAFTRCTRFTKQRKELGKLTTFNARKKTTYFTHQIKVERVPL